MDNLTHSLFGAVLYRSGFHRYLPGTLPLWIIGANLPDIDVVIRLAGSTAYLHHHRGLSHAIPGILCLSLLLATLWWLGQRMWWRSSQGAADDLEPRARPSWWRLWFSSLLVIGTHPLLDALNNYGVRPFLPLAQRWYYGDLVVVVDLWIWLILAGALYLQFWQPPLVKCLWATLAIITTLLVLVVFRERIPLLSQALWIAGLLAIIVVRYVLIESQRTMSEFHDIGWARVALFLLVGYLSLLLVLQQVALRAAVPYLQQQLGYSVQRYSVSPSLANPLNWEVFAEDRQYFYYGGLSFWSGARPLARVASQPDHWAVQTALKTPDGQVMAEFSRYLIAQTRPVTGGVEVILQDGRYARNPQIVNFTMVIFVPNPNAQP